MTRKKMALKILSDHRVEELSDETHLDQGYWFYFHYGWINPLTETHMIHEDTLRECLAQLRDIKPCRCEECIEGMAKEATKRCLRCGKKMPEKAALCGDCANELLGVTDGTIWQ